ncbi:hypothetical protein [Bdellovibrio sp. HCB337]|uniref:hypothetical protein n=1 Tax=Bdellovibrio sp. HCB337 TaxID=3394358 RepID=UPI0039A5AED3
MLVRLLLSVISLTLILSSEAMAGGCYNGITNCDWASAGGRGPAAESSSTGGKVKINPAAVPTEKGFGLETITYDVYTDVGLVRGNGRIGAAISPSNSEETFFGPPGFADPFELALRKYERKKYPSQKVTLATAFDIAQKKGSGLKSYSLKFGAMGRYNKLTKAALPGAGLTGTLGPISFGGSVYEDQTKADPDDVNMDGLSPVHSYQVRTYSVGLFLSSLVVDYSHMSLDTDDTYTVQLLTASLYWKKLILTAAKRIENSPNPAYNFETQMLEYTQIKEEVFGGLQYSVTKNLMLGALYNYYLLREYSISATLFF